MTTGYYFPIVSNMDEKLPLYVNTAGTQYQNALNRAYGIPHYQLLFTLKGSGTYFEGNKKHILNQNCILFLPPDTTHKYKPNEEWQVLYITYTMNWYNNYFTVPNNVFIPSDIEPYLSIAKEIASMYSVPNFCRESSPLLYKLLLTLHTEANSITEPNNKLTNVHHYIVNHFSEDLDLKYLSGMCGLVPEYFCRMYKKQYSLSPIEHMHKLRMQDAKNKLINTNMSVSQISKSVGYKSHSYFSMLFRQQEMLTPQQFRDLYKNSNS